MKKDGTGAKLSPNEQRIASQLFRSAQSVVLECRNHTTIAAAKNALKPSLAIAFEKTHFINNRRAFLSGVLLSAAIAAAIFPIALRFYRFSAQIAPASRGLCLWALPS